MVCEHKNTKREKIEKYVLDLTFEYETLVCQDCGAYLRGVSFEKAYMQWLEGIYKDSKCRNKFQVQCHFSKNLIKCAETFLGDYPGISSTVFIRLLATIYLDVIDTNENLSMEFDQLLDEKILESFSSDKEKKKTNIQFKPKMMLDILAISELVEIKPYQIIESSVIKMMAAITQQDEKLREFWEKEIRSYLEVFLKAA